MKEHYRYITGYPSGEILNITYPDYYRLIPSYLISWNYDLNCFLFDDKNKQKIIDSIKEIKLNDIVKIKNTKEIGEITQIINEYHGQLINNVDVSDLFNFGDKIYVVKFKHFKNKAFTIHDIEKLSYNNSDYIKLS